MAWAAGCGRDIDIEDIEWGASDGDGDSLDFKVSVVGVGGEPNKADGVMDQKCETAPSVALAVFADEVVAFEGWDG